MPRKKPTKVEQFLISRWSTANLLESREGWIDMAAQIHGAAMFAAKFLPRSGAFEPLVSAAEQCWARACYESARSKQS